MEYSATCMVVMSEVEGKKKCFTIVYCCSVTFTSTQYAYV